MHTKRRNMQSGATDVTVHVCCANSDLEKEVLTMADLWAVRERFRRTSQRLPSFKSVKNEGGKIESCGVEPLLTRRWRGHAVECKTGWLYSDISKYHATLKLPNDLNGDKTLQRKIFCCLFARTSMNLKLQNAFGNNMKLQLTLKCLVLESLGCKPQLHFASIIITFFDTLTEAFWINN